MSTTTTVLEVRFLGRIWLPAVTAAGQTTIDAETVEAYRPRVVAAGEAVQVLGRDVVAAADRAMILDAIQLHLETHEGDFQSIDRLDVRRVTTVETWARDGEWEVSTRCARLEQLVEFGDDDEAAWALAMFGDLEDAADRLAGDWS